MRHMLSRGGAWLVCGLALSACYGSPPSSGHSDAGGGAGGAVGGGDAAATGGSVGGHGGGGSGGESGAAGTAGWGGSGGGGALGGDQGGSGGTSGGGGSSGSGGFAGTGGSAGSSGSAGSGFAGAGGTSGSGGSGAAACMPTCDVNHACVGGRCLLADAQQCVSASQCASGVCNPFYVDVDGDGYGTGQPVGFCTLTAAPIGYAAQNGDCCDDASNIALAKLIHPGADFQTTSAGGICGGITWDYDCDGTIESNPQTIACNWDGQNNCSATVVNWAQTSCGTPPAGCNCSVAGPSCVAACVGHSGTIACK
jgi:hypothetical protein